MFSHNGKISEKQMRRMLVLSTFASSIFVIPYLSARLFGASVLPGLLVFLVLAWIYVTCIYGIGAWYAKKREYGKKKETDRKHCRGEMLEHMGYADLLSNSGIAGKTLLVLQLFRLLFRLSFYIILAAAILGEAQVPFMQGKEMDNAANFLVVLPLLLVALYGADREIEKQGRIHEMIFWVLFIPFIIVLLFGLGEVDYGVFIPRMDMPFSKLLLYGYALLTFVLPVENYLYLRPALRETKTMVKKEKGADGKEKGSRLQRKKQSVWISYTAVLVTIVLTAVLTLFLLGVYGVNGAGKEEMVTIAIMRYIRLPFGVLERFDVLMVWFFMTGCFVLICTTLYYAGYLLKLFCGKVKRIWLLVIVLAMALVITVVLPEYPASLMLFLCYGALLDIPLSLIIPLLGMGLAGKDRKKQEGEEI